MKNEAPKKPVLAWEREARFIFESLGNTLAEYLTALRKTGDVQSCIGRYRTNKTTTKHTIERQTIQNTSQRYLIT